MMIKGTGDCLLNAVAGALFRLVLGNKNQKTE